MGQKVNPIGFRLAVNRDWRSRWFATKKEMPEFLLSDVKIRAYVKKKLQLAAVSKVVIERAWNSLRVTIHTARPGIVIGRKGAEIEKMTEDISKMSGGKQVKIDIAGNQDSRTRRPTRRRKRRPPDRTPHILSPRDEKSRSDHHGFRCPRHQDPLLRPLGGAEISRAEWYREGKNPASDPPSAIDYGFAEAMTVYGKIGVKCWVCKQEEGAPAEAGTRRPPPPRRAALE